MHAALDPRPFGEAFEQRPNVGGLEGKTSKRTEERPPTIQAEDRAPVDRPLPDEGEGLGVESNGPVAGLPARDAKGACCGVEIGGPKGEGLADPEPRAPEHHEKRAVAKPGGRVPAGFARSGNAERP